ncbi:hypothetical protein FGIG_01445 [Fasciola gigantica]|uniref:Uncharacterized protein n=1 Tax=Fasciola gigantica TaxID=46835 RepID=A0A504YS71_FASGI|nr:hypothetical protein FGIG_01445 [Fasciola gigantica]
MRERERRTLLRLAAKDARPIGTQRFVDGRV